MRQLEVFNNDIPVGLLTEVDKSHYEFQYYDDYLNSLLPAISFNLPKRKEKYTSQYLFPLFYNMLPEGANKKCICKNARIDERDAFGLLSFFAGKDFIGAVNVRNPRNVQSIRQ